MAIVLAPVPENLTTQAPLPKRLNEFGLSVKEQHELYLEVVKLRQQVNTLIDIVTVWEAQIQRGSV